MFWGFCLFVLTESYCVDLNDQNLNKAELKLIALLLPLPLKDWNYKLALLHLA